MTSSSDPLLRYSPPAARSAAQIAGRDDREVEFRRREPLPRGEGLMNRVVRPRREQIKRQSSVARSWSG